MDISKVINLHEKDLQSANVDEIFADLWEENILEDEEYFEAKNKETPGQKWLHLQECISRGGDSAFNSFLKCLQQRNQKEVARQMCQGKIGTGWKWKWHLDMIYFFEE